MAAVLIVQVFIEGNQNTFAVDLYFLEVNKAHLIADKTFLK